MDGHLTDVKINQFSRLSGVFKYDCVELKAGLRLMNLAAFFNPLCTY